MDKTSFDIGSEKEFLPVRVPVDSDDRALKALAAVNADKTWEFQSATAIEVYGEPYIVYLFARSSVAFPLA